jgi:hypothetical protein
MRSLPASPKPLFVPSGGGDDLHPNHLDKIDAMLMTTSENPKIGSIMILFYYLSYSQPNSGFDTDLLLNTPGFRRAVLTNFCNFKLRGAHRTSNINLQPHTENSHTDASQQPTATWSSLFFVA